MTDPLDRMEREIDSQVDFLPICLQSLRDQLRSVLPPSEAAAVERVHLVGCGDSYQAGLATTLAFGRWAGLPAEAHLALEFTGYRTPLLGAKDLVVPISNSGRVARTVEAAVMAKARGVPVLAITGDGDGHLARETGRALVTDAAEGVGVTPGTHSFLASLAGAWEIARHLAEVRHSAGPEEVAAVDNALDELPGLMKRLLEECRAWPEPVLALFEAGVPAHILGAGPAWAMALCAQMKLLESAALTALPFELEEWAHSGFFLATSNTPVMILVPPGESVARAKEIVKAPLALGAPLVVIAPAGEQSAWGSTAHHIELPADLSETLSPALIALPIQTLALALARRRAATPLGFDDARRREINFEQIFDSEVRGEPPRWKAP
jgi:glucosamine--fructose-6-phosphate aminotransferase (isomerizing)